MDAVQDLSVDHWVAHLAGQPVPVLRATRDALLRWREQPDRVDANALADTVLHDPLMTLRVLVHVAQVLGPRLATPVETVTGGLVLLGIEPFFSAFGELPTVEDRLGGSHAAMDGVLRAIDRARAASRLAAAFAIHRQDADVEVLHQAALLDNVAELLLWCEAPALALEMAHRQRQDSHLRSAEVQHDVLGVALTDLQQALLAHWGLPDFLLRMLDETRHAEPGPHTVLLAVRLARHLRAGAHNAALPDDFAELGALLNMPAQGAQRLAMEVVG